MGLQRLLRSIFAGRTAQRVVGSDAQVFIDGTPHPVIDWSESGLSIARYSGSPKVGERFAFRFVLQLTSEDVFEFDAWAEVIHNDESGIGVRYLSLEEELAKKLRAVVRVMGTTDVTLPKGAISYD